VFWQVALVFGLIAMLCLVLRWVFSPPAVSRDPALPRRRRLRLFRRRRTRADDGRGALRPVASPISPAAATSRSTPGLGGTAKSGSDDYGLLAVATEVSTSEEATAVRRLLTEAGIRSTSTVAGDGRHKVLVFGHELMRARRVTGRAQGGTSGAQGAGNS
jgi:hypothetical protein